MSEKNPIHPELEKQIQYYAEHLFDPGKAWNSEDIENEVFKFIDVSQRGDYIDKLATRFMQIWVVYYRLERFLEADRFWDFLLNLYEKWEQSNKPKILVKGTPYYCRGMSAVAYGNIDRGFQFIHQAFEDDYNKEKFRPYNKDDWSPAWAFVTFNYADPRQAAAQLLRSRAIWLDHYLSEYRDSGRGDFSLQSLSSALSLEALGKELEDKVQLMEITFYFTYVVFKSEDLLSYLSNFGSGKFASQLALDTLFSMCRIAEMWLTEKQEECQGMLNRQLDYYFKKHDSQINSNDLKSCNSMCIDDFKKGIERLLNNEQVLPEKTIEQWEFDLILVYVIRNEGGHAATSSDILCARFEELLERTYFGLFKIIETLH